MHVSVRMIECTVCYLAFHSHNNVKCVWDCFRSLRVLWCHIYTWHILTRSVLTTMISHLKTLMLF